MPTDFSRASAVVGLVLGHVEVVAERLGDLRPIRITGLSEVIGSWNTIAISVPQMPRISVGLAPVMSALVGDLPRRPRTLRGGAGP